MNEASGFSEILTRSALDRDEKECLDKFGSIAHRDISFSSGSILTSSVFDLVPGNCDSLFANLDGETSQKPLRFELNDIDVDRLENLPSQKFLIPLPPAKLSEIKQNTVKISSPDIEEMSEYFRKSLSASSIPSSSSDVLPSIKTKYVLPSQDLVIESTHESISWPSVQLGDSSIMRCYIRHNSLKSEDFNISFSDVKGPANSFKIIDNNNLKYESSIAIKAKEIYEISIIFKPKQVSQVASNLVIRRTSSLGLTRKCIKLFAYGGRGILMVDIPFSVEERKPLINFHRSRSIATFTVSNYGCDTIYFALSVTAWNKVKWTFSIHPFIGNINAGKSENITIKTMLGKEINLLDLDVSDLYTKLGEVNIIYGDESSRLRISRVHNKYQAFKPALFSCYSNELKQILHPSLKDTGTDVSALDDTELSFPTLFNHGVKIWKADLVTMKDFRKPEEVPSFMHCDFVALK